VRTRTRGVILRTPETAPLPPVVRSRLPGHDDALAPVTAARRWRATSHARGRTPLPCSRRRSPVHGDAPADVGGHKPLPPVVRSRLPATMTRLGSRWRTDPVAGHPG